MKKQRTWKCKCGEINDINKSICINCGRHISQEEEE